MRIIDLLNKIANGEEVPEKIRFEGKIFEKQDETSFYCTGFGIFEQAFVLEDLNKKVEIIEEDKRIEKLENEIEFYSYSKYEELKNDIDKVLYILKAINLVENKINNLNNKINEIIDYLNKEE